MLKTIKCSKNVVAIHEIKPVLTLDKPIYAGLSILEFVFYNLQTQTV